MISKEKRVFIPPDTRQKTFHKRIAFDREKTTPLRHKLVEKKLHEHGANKPKCDLLPLLKRQTLLSLHQMARSTLTLNKEQLLVHPNHLKDTIRF